VPRRRALRNSHCIHAPQRGLAVPIKGLPTKVSICTHDPNSLLRQFAHFSGQSVGHRRMRYSGWRSAKRIASWPSCANAFRADSSESLSAINWTDEHTEIQSPNSRAIFAASRSAVVRSSCTNETRTSSSFVSITPSRGCRGGAPFNRRALTNEREAAASMTPLAKRTALFLPRRLPRVFASSFSLTECSCARRYLTSPLF
jgi:hypothetical protein